MTLTNAQLLELLEAAGEQGLTVIELARHQVPATEGWWRLRRLEQRGLAVRAGTRGRVGDRGRPARVFLHAPSLALHPARKNTFQPS